MKSTIKSSMHCPRNHGKLLDNSPPQQHCPRETRKIPRKISNCFLNPAPYSISAVDMGAKCCKGSGRLSGDSTRNSGAYSAQNRVSDSGENPRIKEIRTRAEFDTLTRRNDGKIVVVDFYAPWCGPCQLVAPKVDLYADEFADKVLFIKVNVDEHDELASSYGISCMPTFIIFKKGEKIDEFSGANVDKLRQLIQKHSSKL